MRFPADTLSRAAKVKLLLMDVDGVLTDGKLYNIPGPDGVMVETKPSPPRMASASDGWPGTAFTGVISGRVSPATVERATQVEMAYVYREGKRFRFSKRSSPRKALRLSRFAMWATISPTLF